MELKTVLSLTAILMTALSFGFVFAMQFEKKVKESIQKREWNNILIQVVMLLFSVFSAYFIALILAKYIDNTFYAWLTAASLDMLGLIQFVYINFNGIKKILFALFKNKTGIDFAETEQKNV